MKMMKKTKKWILSFSFAVLITIFFSEGFLQKCKISGILYADENISFNSRAMKHFSEGIIYDLKKDYARAILEYQDAARFDSSVHIFYLSMAEDYYYLRMDERSMLMYEKYLELNPNDYVVNTTLLKKLYLPKREYQKAERLLERMIRINPNSATIKLLLSDVYLKNNKIDKAVKNSSSFLVNPSVGSDIYRYIARSFIRTNKIGIGISVFETFIKDFKKNDKLYYGLGILYLAKNDTSRVVELFEDGININKDANYIKDALCDIYIDMNKLEKAKALFMTYNLSLESRIRIADAFYINRRDKEAESLFNILKEEGRDVYWIYFRLGEIKYNENNYTEAVNNFLRALGLDSSVTETHFRLALSYYRLKDYDKALRYINNSIEMKPKELRFLNLKADIVNNIGDFYKTEKIYEEIFKIDPEYDLALNNFSYILSERGEKLYKALEMSKKAVKKRPRNGSYLDTLGWIYYKLNQYENALKYLKEAAGITSQESEPHPVILEHLGDVYLKLGDIYNAKHHWRKALEVDKGNKELLRKIEEY